MSDWFGEARRPRCQDQDEEPECDPRQDFAAAAVSVTVSLGAKPAQAEGDCLIVHRLVTVAHLLSLSSDLSDSLDHSPNAFALAQGLPENRVAFDRKST